jgi:cell division protein FtsB
LTWSDTLGVINCDPMKVDLRIWDRLSRFIILLLIVAAVLGVALWYVPVIRDNEQMRKQILTLERQIELELQRSRELSAEVESYRDPRTVERLARELLKFSRPDEFVIRFEDPPLTNRPASHR